jgi:hypothetical protein
MCSQHAKARLDLALSLHTLHRSKRVATAAESYTEQSKTRVNVKVRSWIDDFTETVPFYLSIYLCFSNSDRTPAHTKNSQKD